MNLSAVDLNLLVVLDAVLVERSATRAAKRLGVTQPAVSNALVRLRDLFGDPLVVREGRGLTLTPRAENLAPRVARLVRDAGALLADDAPFDPATSDREFTLACADYYGMVVLPPLMESLRAKAPRARVRLVSLEELVAGGGLATDVDVHVGRPATIPAGCQSVALFDEAFVCLVRSEPIETARRPARTTRATRPMSARISLRDYTAAEHVRVRVLGNARDPIDRVLQKRGIVRRVGLTVPHFSLAPLVVLRTGWIATMAARLAHLYASFLPLTVRRPPIDLSPRPVHMIWHARTARDPGARFFRDLLVATSSAT